MTALLVPLAHATARGLLAILPPQAKPAQPMVTGAAIWITAS